MGIKEAFILCIVLLTKKEIVMLWGVCGESLQRIRKPQNTHCRQGKSKGDTPWKVVRWNLTCKMRN